jgi:hypothetical protein
VKRQETYCIINVATVRWLMDYVYRETAVARNGVHDEESTIMHDMASTENAEAITRKPETMYQEMLNVIGDSLKDLASSTNQQDGADEE